MIHITLQRNLDTGSETLGTMWLNSDTKPYMTIERPWKNNDNGTSCIPAGTYKFVPHGWEPNTPFKKIRCWELVGVPDRTGILIHSANFSSELLGCIAPGKVRGKLEGVPAVIESKVAMDELRKTIGQNSGTITILEVNRA